MDQKTVADDVSVASFRFEQMEAEVASLRHEIKSLQATKLMDISEVDSEPSPLLVEAEKHNEKFEQLENTIAALQGKVEQMEAEKTIEQSLKENKEQEKSEIELMKAISVQRIETLVSSFLPFLSETKSRQIARWMNESIGFSARNSMRRIWSLILLIDLACIFVQARFPQVWQQLNLQQIPRGWYKRVSTMRYCLEMILIVQFGIAAQQLATHQRTISVVKSTVSTIYESFRILLAKYLPTGLVIACTASFAAWLYRNRLAQQMLL